ncbi:unnamed protein product [Nezara viridula]|uniref:Sugar phosphate transporter domain-containing protein n=1 Tax=Nezara viridula TaxID=85310 RepID=A0A9P0E717_NEZVI|nr:unnamed protein product [Nezara viridula]
MARVVLHETDSDKNLNFHNNHCFSNLITSAGIILIYFPLSIGLTFYQRWFLKDFHFPLLVVMVHLLTKFFAAALCRSIWKCCTGKKRIRLDWPNTVRKIVPTGLSSGLDVAFSNWGIELITVSLYTMTKSTAIVFLLIFALLFKLEEKTWSLFLTVSMISGGLVLFTYKAAQFNLLGFLLVMFASLCSGLRWTLAQFVMQKSDVGLSNPIDMLYHVQPWMFFSILPFVMIFEAGDAITGWNALVFPQDYGIVWAKVGYILLGSVLALAMELSEYLVVSRMSSLTLSVAGIFKEVCTLTLAIEWNGDVMSKLNFVGLLFCLAGICLHVFKRGSKESNRNRGRSKSLDEASARFLAEATASSDDDDNRDDSSTEVLFSVLQSRDR